MVRRCDEAGAPARALAAQAGRRVPLAGPVLAELTRQLADWEQLSGELCAAAVPLDPRAACTAVGLDAVSTYVAWLESAPPSQPAAAWDRLMELPPSDTCRLLRHADAPAWTPHAAARQRALLQQLIGRVGGASPELLETDTLPRALALSAAVLAAPCADEALLQEAVSAARRAHHPVELKLWGQLAACQSARGGLKEAAFSLGMGEEVASAQAEGAPVRLSFDLQRVRVLHQGGRLDEAEALAARTLEVTARAVGQGHWLHAAALSRQAEVWMMRGRFAEVAALYRAALPVLERAFGPEDKRVLSAHHNLGSALAADHRYDEALREYAPLLLREGGWKNSPLTSDLVPVMLALGRSAEALKLGRAAIFDISERDPAVFSRRTQQLSAWAQAELAAGDPREVLRRMTVTLELEPLSAAPFESASLFRIFQAGALRRLGRAAEALALLDTVRATLRPVQKLLPTEQLLSAERARCLLELGKAQEARAELTRLDLDSRGGLDPLERARIWQQVARSLEASGRGPEALALASKAQQALAALAPRAQ